MSQYRKRPIVISATQWFSKGDHPAVSRLWGPIYPRGERCGQCDKPYGVHGWIATLEGGHVVCQGDWIITGIAGEHYPCKPDIFDLTYESV